MILKIIIVLQFWVICYLLGKNSKLKEDYKTLLDLNDNSLTLTLMGRAYNSHIRLFGGEPKEYLLSSEDFEEYGNIMSSMDIMKKRPKNRRSRKGYNGLYYRNIKIKKVE